ncbi:MAG: TonB-dependent receptor [Bacteroidetes bacterium]|jgi:hypothetical protein|nr:TonB-dependent receptor [Bacteroidota bacterium]
MYPAIRLFLLLLLGCLYTSAWGQNTIRGTVFDEEGQPVAGAAVLIVEQQRGTYTNTEGIFSIDKLPNGSFTLQVLFFGYDTLQQSLTLANGEIRTSSLYLTPYSLESIEVQAGQKIDRNRPDIGLVRIEAKDIQRLPSLGLPDLSQYLQVVPGVVFTGDQGGQLYIRGGTPVQNLALLDGNQIYNPFHSLGLFSVFDTEVLQDVQVYSAGFPARYGGRISSVMDISTRSGSFRQHKAKLNLNSISSGLLVEGPIGGRRAGQGGLGTVSYLLSARTLYLDRVSQAGQPYRYTNDTIGLPFSFLDLYGKLTLGNGANRLSLSGFRQQDQVDYNFPTSYRWYSQGGGAEFQVLPNQTNLILSGSVGVSNYNSEQKEAEARLARTSSIGGFNSRLNFSYILNTVNQFDMGLQLQGFRTEFAYTNELDLSVESQDNNTEFAYYATYRQVFRTKRTGANGETEYFSRFVLEPGLRLHYYNDHSYLSIEPRLSSKLNFEGFSLQGSWGLFTQNIVSTTSDLDVVALFQGYASAPPARANGVLNTPLQAATHYLLGLELDFIRNTSLKLEGWYKDFRQVTNLNRRRFFPEDPAWITEVGEAYGADLSVRYQPKGGLYLYATYGWAYNERDDFSQTYNPVWDRRHTFNLVASYTRGNVANRVGSKILGKRWEFSARCTGGSGFPFTQTQGAYEELNFLNNGSQSNVANQNGRLGVVLADDLNGARLPDYLRFDLSVKRRFRVGAASLLELNANALNVLDRDNIFYFDRVRYVRVDQLPFIPTLGVSLSI